VASEKAHVHVAVEPSIKNVLLRIASKDRKSMTAVITQAIRLYWVIWNAIRLGDSVEITLDEDGNYAWSFRKRPKPSSGRRKTAS
jgi:hypothetical protein